jgi:CRISPR-associated endonuclease/helicase Cas3
METKNKMKEKLIEIMSNHWAKDKGETIEEHTNKVLKSFEILANYANFSKEEKEIIRELIFFHDLGKVQPSFQKKVGNLLFKDFKDSNIPHELISPSFVWQDKRKEIKENLSKMGLDKEELFKLFVFLIISHHRRGDDIYNDEKIDEKIKKAIDYLNNYLKEKFNIQLNLEHYYRVSKLVKLFNDFNNHQIEKFFPYRVRWLGALIKSDYSASAEIEPETPFEGEYSKKFINFVNEKKFKLNDFQIKAGENSNKNIVLIASTGMGKTEASMNWINGSKGIYLLGIRTAVNEVFKRYRNVFGEKNVGLLHGESLYFLIREDNDKDFETKIEKVRKLSYPITIATGDQLVTSVFKYPGFELNYLTCSYSKIVVDEIQSYEPSSIASIVVFLREIHKLGGKFMLMTATMPPFVKKEFEELDNVVFLGPYFTNLKRHKIKIIDEDINNSNELTKIIENNQDKKILIILNTVKKAQEIYSKLRETELKTKVNLIHSRFTQKDRREKENTITNTIYPSIWITTQVVEASIDIDFDILITECSSVESLLQRLGRCYRKREYNLDTPNVYIFKPDKSNIYDRRIVQRTWEILKNCDGKLIAEPEKYEIMESIFSNIDDTEYYNDYQKKKGLLELGYSTNSKQEAFQEFRGIVNNYSIIPENVFIGNKDKIEELLFFIDDKNKSRYERFKKQAEFMDYIIPIQWFYGKKLTIVSPGYFGIDSDFCGRHGIQILQNCDYTFEKGLVFKDEEINNNIID